MNRSESEIVGVTDFASASRAFKRWRSERPRGARIPERLWEMAVALAGEHGINQTAQALQLDYYAVKKRLDEVDEPNELVRTGVESRARFVEVSPTELSSLPQRSVEFETGVGTTSHVRMKIEIGCASLEELGALIERVWPSPQ